MADTLQTTALSSMTGFAARQGAVDGWSWTVDIRSVNGRGLDLRFRLPDWIEGLEPELRKALQGRLHRGTVNVGIRVQRDEAAAVLTLNQDALSHALSLLTVIRDKAETRGLKTRKPSAAEIAAIRGVLDTSEAAAAGSPRAWAARARSQRTSGASSGSSRSTVSARSGRPSSKSRTAAPNDGSRDSTESRIASG